MRSGKRDGPDAPRPAPEKAANQNQSRSKQTASGNENGTLAQEQ
jgi:plasminogen activator inhibitor 1 RNA-binding protein